jgi:hypothetical protein
MDSGSGAANATLCGNNATNTVTRVLPLLIVANKLDALLAKHRSAKA